MKNYFKKNITNDFKLEKWQIAGILCLIICASGIFGWIYEFIFYYFNGGMKEFYMQGGNFLPWINIYAWGAIIVLLLTYNSKRNPLIVFLISSFSTGLFEYISGLSIYYLMGGLRLWDYNSEILNFGNIGGFVCLRSVLFFGFSSLFLVYYMVPFFIYMSEKMNKKMFLILSISLCFIFLFDEFYNLLLSRIFNLPRASYIYQKLGFKYVKF